MVPRASGSSLVASPICPQIRRPVVKTDPEQLAQELEGLAQGQVRSRQRRPQGWGRAGCLHWRGDEGRGRGPRVPSPVTAELLVPKLGWRLCAICSNSSSATNWLCGLGQVVRPL